MEDDDLNPDTKKYIKNTSKEKRHEMGQFFTPQDKCRELFRKLPEEVKQERDLKVLDPASGTGEFLDSAIEFFSNADVYGWEKDKNLVDISEKIVPEANIKNVDSLFYNPNIKFDLVVGNPPYYEINIDERLRKSYDDIIYGRTNIYSLFIYKSLQVLKSGGHLAFIVPPSMNNGAYFKKLRKYIIENCSIEYMEIQEDCDIFQDASQPVMFLVLKKGGDNDDYIFSKNSISIFSEKADYLEEEFKGKKSLSEIGYKVTTGSFTWNENREKLVKDESSDCVLIWSKNILEDGLEIGLDVHDKPQYVKDVDCNTGPAIVVNRVIGQPGNGEIRAAFIEEGMDFVAENHVNVIEHKDGCSIGYDKLLSQIRDNENVELLQSITGNSQLSKTELQELFPVKVS